MRRSSFDLGDPVLLGRLLLASSLLLSVALRVPYYQHKFIFVDEAWWANAARTVADGGRLYHDVWIDKQPLLILFCALLFKTFGASMHAVHFGSLALVLISCVLVHRIGSIFSPLVGGAAAVIYALASTMYHIPRLIGMNTETLMVVFGSGSMLCLLKGLRSDRQWMFAASGLLSAFAVLSKPVALLETAVVIGAPFIGTKSAENTTIGRLRKSMSAAAGFLAGLALCGLCLNLNGTLAAWWDQTVAYEIYYVRQLAGTRLLRKMILAQVGFLLAYLWLWILVWKGRSRAPCEKRERTLLTLWLIAACIAVIGSRRFYANYFIQVFPPMALLGGMGVVYWFRSNRTSEGRSLRLLAASAFLLSFLWFHSRTLAHWYFLANPAAHEKTEFWGMCRDDRTIAAIGRAIQRHGGSRDHVFVWGSKPELYFQSDRRMCSRYMEYDITADVPKGAAAGDTVGEVIRDLETKQPSHIVDVSGSTRIDEIEGFRDVLQRHQYELDREIKEARLYCRRGTGIHRAPGGDLSGRHSSRLAERPAGTLTRVYALIRRFWYRSVLGHRHNHRPHVDRHSR